MLRLRPINEKSVPHGGWRYTQHHSEREFHYPSLKWLVKEVRIHREAMHATGHDPALYDLTGGWQERLMHEICLQMDGDCPCEEYDSETGKPTRKWLGVTDVRRWWNTVKDWRAQGRPFVDESEAIRRAEICKKCNKNQRVDGCLGCHGIAGEVASFLTGMKSLKEDDLHVCAQCHCFLRAKVWLPLDVVDNSGVEFPDHCWQKENVSVS
jgi:hypothetical protein